MSDGRRDSGGVGKPGYWGEGVLASRDGRPADPARADAEAPPPPPVEYRLAVDRLRASHGRLRLLCAELQEGHRALIDAANHVPFPARGYANTGAMFCYRAATDTGAIHQAAEALAKALAELGEEV